MRGVRVTVVDGVVVQARDTFLHCDVPLAEAPTIDDLFNWARAAGAGAVIDVDEQYGFIRSFQSSADRPRVILGVPRFWPDAYPLAATRGPALDDARAAWQAAEIDDYTMTIDIHSAWHFDGPMEVTVTDGVVTSTSTDAPEWAPITVEALFDTIDAELGADHLEMAFHPELGFPIVARVDPGADTSDDEFSYFVSELIVN